MFAGEIELHVGIWSAWKRKKRFGLSIEDLKNMRKGIISSSRMEILYLKKIDMADSLKRLFFWLIPGKQSWKMLLKTIARQFDGGRQYVRNEIDRHRIVSYSTG